MWGLRIRIPLPPGLRGDAERRSRKERSDSDAPSLAGVPRTTDLRSDLATAASLYRSPLRWILVVPAFVGALLSMAAAAVGIAGALALVALLLTGVAAFAGRRVLRAAASLELLVAGVVSTATAAPWWAGVPLLVAGLGFLAGAVFGPNARGGRQRSRAWIREHARSRPAARPPAVTAKSRGRALVEAGRRDPARWRSPLLWALFAWAGGLGAIALVASPFDRHSPVLFLAAITIPATALAAFGPWIWLRILTGLAAAAAGAGLAAYAVGVAAVLGLPVAAAGVALAALAGARGVPRPRGEDASSSSR